jgi:hypothetical protein
MDEVLGTFSSMRSCYEFVVARPPLASWNSAQMAAHFAGAKRALVRCFRNVLRRQMLLVNWSQTVSGNYQQTDSIMYLLLSMFAQQ